MTTTATRPARYSQPFAAGLDAFAGDEMLAIAEGLSEVHHGDNFCEACDSFHEPLAALIDAFNLPVHMAPDSFTSAAERQASADMVSRIVGAGDARRAAADRRGPGAEGWGTIDPRTLGADARRVWDTAFGAGEYTAARGKHRLPPAHFDAMERAAFARGFRAEVERTGEADDAAGDEPFGHDPMEYAEAGMRSPYAEERD